MATSKRALEGTNRAKPSQAYKTAQTPQPRKLNNNNWYLASSPAGSRPQASKKGERSN